jgi:hypothetical protein
MNSSTGGRQAASFRGWPLAASAQNGAKTLVPTIVSRISQRTAWSSGTHSPIDITTFVAVQPPVPNLLHPPTLFRWLCSMPIDSAHRIAFCGRNIGCCCGRLWYCPQVSRHARCSRPGVTE